MPRAALVRGRSASRIHWQKAAFGPRILGLKSISVQQKPRRGGVALGGREQLCHVGARLSVVRLMVLALVRMHDAGQMQVRSLRAAAMALSGLKAKPAVPVVRSAKARAQPSSQYPS